VSDPTLKQILLNQCDNLSDSRGEDRVWVLELARGLLWGQIGKWSLYVYERDKLKFFIARELLGDEDLAFQVSQQVKTEIECVKMCKAALILKGDF
jgi:hypothetical protein